MDKTRRYFNAQFFNNSGAPLPASYDVSLASPLIHNPQKWQLAINRLCISSLALLPILTIPQLNDRWLFAFGYNSGSGWTYSSLETINYPPGYIKQSSPDGTRVGCIYTYEGVVEIINYWLSVQFAAFKSAHPSWPPTTAPSIQFDATTQLFVIYLDNAFQEQGISRIFFNTAFTELFALPSQNDYEATAHFNPTNLPYANFRYLIVHRPLTSSNQIIPVYQETSTASSIYDVARLIIVSNRGGVSGEGEGRVFSGQSAIANQSLNIITDIIPTDLSPSADIVYIPNGILRWYNLYQTTPLTEISLQVYYETNEGEVYQLYLPTREFFSTKIEYKTDI